MNPDDPKFTAHALGELEDLTPEERAEIEALLASDPTALAEAQEMQSLAARLRAELPGEEAAALNEVQRAAVLAAATAPLPRKTLRFSRPAKVLWSLAACLVLLVSLGFFFPPIHIMKVSMSKEPRASAQERRNDADSSTIPSPVQHSWRVAQTRNSAVLSDDEVAASQRPTEREERAKALADRSAMLASASLVESPAEGLVSLPAVQLQAPDSPALAQTQPAPKALASPSQLAAGTTTNLTTSDFSKTVAGIPAPPVPAAKSVPLDDPASKMGVAANMGWRSSRTLRSVAEPSPAKLGSTSAGFSAHGGVTADGVRRAGVAGGPTDRGEELVREEKRQPMAPLPAPVDREAFDAITDNAFLAARENPLSTFSTDVDTASYAIVRRYLTSNQRPPKGAVRIEELLNYFPYDYPQPQGEAPFSATMEVAACPWTPEHRLVRIGLKGREIAKDQRPASNLVFLIDVSGSMQPVNKLPLLKQSLALLIEQLGAQDQVGIVVYAGSSGTVLEPTRDREKMYAALHRLEAGGSTNGASGLQLAYQLAQKHFIPGGTNRVILATDGDWNVGTTSQSDLLDLIAEKSKGGVFLTVLGLGMGNLNDSIMVKLAGRGNGNYAYLDRLAEAKKVLVEQLGGTLVTIAKDVKIQVEFNPAQVGAYRLIGYEKRLLAKEDFNNDKKDAGEIGAGHTVTALYEVVPAGKELLARTPPVDALKYQPVPTTPLPGEVPPQAAATGPAANRVTVTATAASGELLTLKLRYKDPTGATSKLLEFPLTDAGKTWEQSSPDLRFAAAVAGYGMLLRDSAYKGETTWAGVEEWAVEGKGKDASGYRGEFLTLIEKAKALTR